MNFDGVMPLNTSTENRFQYNGKELEKDFGIGLSDYGARWYDASIGKFTSVDPLASDYSFQSPYAYATNNPVLLRDILGMGVEDWVRDADGNIRWDNDANSQATTKKGETYLGKSLTFEFSSYIDGSYWDGPEPLVGTATGEKLNSMVTLTASENSKGELTGISASLSSLLGSTPVGTARNYYPGLGGDNNEAGASYKKGSDGTLKTYSFSFEQHASVSLSEELAINALGYKIVDVAQRLELSYSNGSLSVSSYTNIFPSASLSVNSFQLMYYQQPSFIKTHRAPVNSLSPPGVMGVTSAWYPGIDASYYPSVLYKR